MSTVHRTRRTVLELFEPLSEPVDVLGFVHVHRTVELLSGPELVEPNRPRTVQELLC